jgi:2-polyprenyl-3-methyl-5-hydroxy-6-metoxy-1,4-benzoquinol methylase
MLSPEEHGKIVKVGYDNIAETYCKNRSAFENTTQIEEFISYLPEKAAVLDIGCGGGIPVLQTIARRGFRVKGIDFSKSMLEIAKRNSPNAELILGDITKTDFKKMSLDGIISTYAFIHIHRDYHPLLYRNMFSWLKPSGVIMICTGADDWSGDEKYFGVRMVWNHAGANENLKLAKAAGFSIISERILTIGGETHYWILARK